jgi:hypothetical protein
VIEVVLQLIVLWQAAKRCYNQHDNQILLPRSVLALRHHIPSCAGRARTAGDLSTSCGVAGPSTLEEGSAPEQVAPLHPEQIINGCHAYTDHPETRVYRDDGSRGLHYSGSSG